MTEHDTTGHPVIRKMVAAFDPQIAELIRRERAGEHGLLRDVGFTALADELIRVVPDTDPHLLHTDEFEEAHATAAGAIMGARMAGKQIAPWTPDMDEAFRAAVAEAFDAGVHVGRKGLAR